MISYEELLDIFWHHIDPTDAGGQFADRGSQYETAIFCLNEDQKERAEKSKSELEKSGVFVNSIVTDIRKATEFYPAEEYHQDFSRKEPEHYTAYKRASGREEFLNRVWQNRERSCPLKIKQAPEEKNTLEQAKKKLSPEQYAVTQNDGTEKPFDNAYWDNKREGIYVDIVSGQPLSSSKDKKDTASLKSFLSDASTRTRRINELLDSGCL